MWHCLHTHSSSTILYHADIRHCRRATGYVGTAVRRNSLTPTWSTESVPLRLCWSPMNIFGANLGYSVCAIGNVPLYNGEKNLLNLFDAERNRTHLKRVPQGQQPNATAGCAINMPHFNERLSSQHFSELCHEFIRYVPLFKEPIANLGH